MKCPQCGVRLLEMTARADEGSVWIHGVIPFDGDPPLKGVCGVGMWEFRPATSCTLCGGQPDGEERWYWADPKDPVKGDWSPVESTGVLCEDCAIVHWAVRTPDTEEGAEPILWPPDGRR